MSTIRGGNSLTIDKIKKIENQTDRFFEYHKRIIMLRKYIIRYPKLKIKYAKELMECQEEQRILRERSRMLDV